MSPFVFCFYAISFLSRGEKKWYSAKQIDDGVVTYVEEKN